MSSSISLWSELAASHLRLVCSSSDAFSTLHKWILILCLEMIVPDKKEIGPSYSPRRTFSLSPHLTPSSFLLSSVSAILVVGSFFLSSRRRLLALLLLLLDVFDAATSVPNLSRSSQRPLRSRVSLRLALVAACCAMALCRRCRRQSRDAL